MGISPKKRGSRRLRPAFPDAMKTQENFFLHIKSKLEKEIKRFECIGMRYEIPYCIMLVAFDEDEDISHLILSSIRCADSFVKIDAHHYAIIFFSSRDDSYSVLSNKLMYTIESEYSAKVSIGVACSNYEENVLLQAVQNLLEAKENSINMIKD